MQICSQFYKIDTIASNLQNLKISGPKHEPRASRISDKRCLNETRASISTHALTHSGSYLTRAYTPRAHTSPSSAMTSFSTMVWPVCPSRLSWPGPNRLQKKEKDLTKLNFDFNQNVKIFKRGLSHSVFRVHSNFGICFFVWDSKIVQTVQVLESWLLHKSWPKVKIFKKDLFCPIFHVDSILGSISSFENPKLLK